MTLLVVFYLSDRSNMAVLVEIRIILLFTIFSTFVDCQITSSPTLKDVCVGDNVDIDWVYGNAGDFLTVTWAYIDSQTSTQTTIMQQTTGGTATVVNNYNAEPNTKFNGGITLTSVTKANSGSYKISVNYITASAVDDTVNLTVKDCTGTTVPPTAPTSPPTPSTTTISPVVIIVPSVVGVFVIVIICIIVCILLRKKSNRGKKYRADPENEEIPQVDINVTKQQ